MECQARFLSTLLIWDPHNISMTRGSGSRIGWAWPKGIAFRGAWHVHQNKTNRINVWYVYGKCGQIYHTWILWVTFVYTRIYIIWHIRQPIFVDWRSSAERNTSLIGGWATQLNNINSTYPMHSFLSIFRKKLEEKTSWNHNLAGFQPSIVSKASQTLRTSEKWTIYRMPESCEHWESPQSHSEEKCPITYNHHQTTTWMVRTTPTSLRSFAHQWSAQPDYTNGSCYHYFPLYWLPYNGLL